MIRPIPLLVSLLFAGALALPDPAAAARLVYRYKVEHPTYGDIGTYTNVVQQLGDEIEVDSELRVAVKFLGIVMYHQDAERTERWRNGRLVSFESTTDTNGEKLQIHGEARADGFAISTPSGTVLAPADVHPSNPWSPRLLRDGTMMSTKTGKLFAVRVSGGGEEMVTLDGQAMRLRQYEVDGPKRGYVWVDDHGVPVAFRTDQNGTLIDFVLVQ